MKKLLALALAALMLAVMLPITALADTTPTVLDFTQENAPTSGDHWTWDSTNKILTLSGASITAQLILPDGATIVVNGTNTISIESYGVMDASRNDYNVVRTDGTVAIIGTGTLNISDGTEEDLIVTDNHKTGCDTWHGNMIVGQIGQAGPTVNMVHYLFESTVVEGFVTVHSGKVKIESLPRGSGGIEGGATVDGGTLEVVGENGGILGSLTVSAGTVIAKALNDATGPDDDEYVGVGLAGELNMTGGTAWFVSHAPGGDYGYRFGPLALNVQPSEKLVIKGSVAYEAQNPTEAVTWRTHAVPESDSDLAELLWPYIGEIPAQTIKITAAGSSGGDDDGPIIEPPAEEEPIRIIVTTPTEPEKNPATGANDMVAAAAALMAVSALGMAALTRKK